VNARGAARSPEVTVVVPTRSRWHHLSRAALPAALGQQDVDLELVVVDDGSLDETPRGLAQLDDARVRTMRNERSEGVARARNRGIAAARAEWVAFLDDDDLWSPLKLRTQLDAARAERADFVYAAAVFVDALGTPLRPDPAPDAATVARALRASDVVGGPSTVMARTALVRQLGGFEPSLSVLADWDLWLRLAEAGRAAACTDVLVAYREHRENMSSVAAARVFTELDLLVRRHGLSADLDGERFTRWVAAQQRAGGRRLAAARAYLRGARRFRSPALLARALAVPLGEPVMRIPARLRALRGAARPDRTREIDPDWLGPYRRQLTVPPCGDGGPLLR
jgi:glycosyltransferase involved in cell wall biosynthesis